MKEYFKRYGIFVIGLMFCAMGIALTKSGGLGVSPISSVPNVLSERFTALSMGEWLFIWNLVMLLAQMVILRRNFQFIQLLQLPLNLVYSAFTDAFLLLFEQIPSHLYPVQLALVLSGTVLLGLGVALSVTAGVILITGEALVKAISDTLHRKFGNVKICFDVGCALLSVLLSLLFFQGTLVGSREGTVIAALGVGSCVKLFRSRLKTIEKWFKK